MAKHIIDTDKDHAVPLHGVESDWVLAAGVAVAVDDAPAALFNAEDKRLHLLVEGAVTNSAADGTGIVMDGRDNDLIIQQSGAVSAETGVSFHAVRFEFVNRGLIDAETTGISGGRPNYEIQNSGEIHSDNGWAIQLKNDFGLIINGKNGLISGVGGIDIDGGVAGRIGVSVTNHGTIESAGTAIDLDKGDDHFVNHGSITGDIFTGDGDDWIDLTGGTVDGEIHGGAGDDFYTVDSDQFAIVEEAGGGYDVVYTTVSFAIGVDQELENLFADGDGDIDLTGSAADNELAGNSGANILSGGEGDDWLSGFGGDDVLNGGTGADEFVIGRDSGADTIEDFTAAGADHDLISIYGHRKIESYDDVVARMTDTADGVLIKLSKHDTILIEDVVKAELTADHFDI